MANAKLIGSIAVVVIVISVIAIVRQSRRSYLPPLQNWSWYYDLNTQKVFSGTIGQIPPIEAPSGVTKEGLPAGVRACVVSCGDCSESEWTIAFLETYAPEMKERLLKLHERARSPEPPRGNAPSSLHEIALETQLMQGRGTLVKRPDDPVGPHRERGRPADHQRNLAEMPRGRKSQSMFSKKLNYGENRAAAVNFKEQFGFDSALNYSQSISYEPSFSASQEGGIDVSSPARRQAGFTLIELLAVVTIIALMVSLLIGLAGYADKKAKVNRARAEIASLSTTCELFKQDRGRYPTTTVFRISMTWYFEAYNASLLTKQLSSYVGAGFPKIATNVFYPCDLTNDYPSTVSTIVDPWETPYNYFCTYPVLPSPAKTNINCGGYGSPPGDPRTTISVGGQRNVLSFDLFSYGPDRHTYENPPVTILYNHDRDYFTVDDITNF